MDLKFRRPWLMNDSHNKNYHRYASEFYCGHILRMQKKFLIGKIISEIVVTYTAYS